MSKSLKELKNYVMILGIMMIFMAVAFFGDFINLRISLFEDRLLTTFEVICAITLIEIIKLIFAGIIFGSLYRISKWGTKYETTKTLVVLSAVGIGLLLGLFERLIGSIFVNNPSVITPTIHYSYTILISLCYYKAVIDFHDFLMKQRIVHAVTNSTKQSVENYLTELSIDHHELMHRNDALRYTYGADHIEARQKLLEDVNEVTTWIDETLNLFRHWLSDIHGPDNYLLHTKHNSIWEDLVKIKENYRFVRSPDDVTISELITQVRVVSDNIKVTILKNLRDNKRGLSFEEVLDILVTSYNTNLASIKALLVCGNFTKDKITDLSRIDKYTKAYQELSHEGKDKFLKEVETIRTEFNK